MSDKRVVVGLVVLVSASLLVGCSHPKKGQETAATTAPSAPSPTSAVETTEPPDQAQINTDNAIAAYRNYVAVANAVRQDYYNGWRDKVLPLASGNQAGWVVWYFTQAADAGDHQVGADVVRSVSVSEYAEDPTGAGHERVLLNACVDSSDVQELDSSGNNQLVPGTMGRFVTTVTMQHMPAFTEPGVMAEDPHGQAWWRVDDLSRDTGSSC